MSEHQVTQAKRTDYRVVFDTPTGKRVLADLAEEFHLGISTHVPQDPYETAYREGRRAVVLHIVHLLGFRSDPERINDLIDAAAIPRPTVQEFE